MRKGEVLTFLPAIVQALWWACTPHGKRVLFFHAAIADQCTDTRTIGN